MKSQKTKELLIKKAIDLFYAHSYVKTPIRKITETLSVENTIIYYYFKSKDELLFSIIDGLTNDLIADLEKIVEKVTDPMERVQEMVYYQITLFRKRKKEIKIFVEDTDKLPPKMQKTIKDKQKKIYRLYFAQFEKLIEENRIKNREIPLICFSLFAMINWTYRWYKDRGPLTIEDVAQQTLDIFFSGILPEKKSGKAFSTSTLIS